MAQEDKEVKDIYGQCIQYDSIEAGIKAHAETYSFNIESELFNQLTKEQQALWRKEIEQAVISGGEMGVELARDPRYKENHETNDEDDQPEHSCLVTTYKCGKKPHWNVGDTLAYYEFTSNVEGEHVFGKVASVEFNVETDDWTYVFDSGAIYDEEELITCEAYKKNR